METSYKFDLMKAVCLLTYLIFFLLATYAWADPHKDCGELPFKTEILKFEPNEECYDVLVEVSNNGKSRFELSHVNISFGKGTISNASNDQEWPMELNHIDPTTRIGGIKVDEVKNFGKDPELTSFQLKFTFCPNTKCTDKKENAITPVVAYKAGQCIYYEEPELEKPKEDEPEENEPDDEVQDGEKPDENHPELLVSTNKIDPTCTDAEGSIELTIVEGTAPYEISWNTGQTEFVLQNLSDGVYVYTVTDASGKQASGEVILNSSVQLDISATVTDSDCQGANNGSIDLVIDGGNAPYTFLWSNGSSDQNLSNLYAGLYHVQVTDATGCASEKNISILNTTSIELDATINQPSCQEGTQGSIELSATGGTAPYTYSWANGTEGASIDGLTDGYYRVNISDQSGCSYSKTYSILTDVGIDAFATVTKTNCFDDPIGAIDLTVSGGTEPYSIEWSNGASTEDISGLSSGNYTVTITDALGCQLTYKTSLAKNDIIINYENLTIPSCNGSVDGAVFISVSNGTEPYNYSWSNGSIDEDISNMPSGKYTVEVTDANGCRAEKTFNLPEPAPIQINYDIISNACSASQDIIISASGGSMEYTYAWPDGSTSNELIDAVPGSYTVIVSDTKMCTGSQEIVVEELAPVTACLIQDVAGEVICSSTENIMMSFASDATSYSWTVSSSDDSWAISSASDQAQIQYSAGSAGSSATFTLTVQYEGGCESVCEKTIEVCTDDSTPDVENPDGNNPDDDTDDGNSDDNKDDGSSDDGTCEDDDINSNPDDESSDRDDDWNKNKDCDECFYTNPIVISKADQGYTYAIEVSHDNCRYELSHMTIEIPECFTLLDYSNSMNWEMERVNQDPTTGLSGIKIDDIPSFGKDEYNTTFMIYLNLTSQDPNCLEKLKCFAPVISYKAATCIYEEFTQSECFDDNIDDIVKTYPNPTHDYLKVNFDKCDKSASYSVALINCRGEKIDSHHFQRGSKKDCIIDLTARKNGLYLIEVKGSNGFRRVQRVIKK